MIRNIHRLAALALLVVAATVACTKDKTVRVTGVSLDTESISLVAGAGATLTATVAPSDAADPGVSWHSDAPGIATVDDAGNVVAVRAGEATVSVVSDDGGHTARCVVRVSSRMVFSDSPRYDITPSRVGTPIAAVDLSGAVEGGRAPYSFAASGLPAGISIGSRGVISGIPSATCTAGRATITVADSSVPAQSASITVDYGAVGPEWVAVQGVTLDRVSLALKEGESERLTFTITPANATDQSVTWGSTAPTVASVNTDGTVTALKAGTAIITVITADGGKSDRCTVTVSSLATPVTAIDITPEGEVTVRAGSTVTLGARITPGDATDKTVTWSSSHPARATVDSRTGIVTGVSAGTVVISATADGVTATKTVRVLPVTQVTAAPVTGVTSPVAMTAPSTRVNDAEGYTASLTWINHPPVFAYGTIYSAHITLVARDGYTFAGNYGSTAAIAGFRVNGIIPEFVSNDGASLRFRITFPATGPTPVPVVEITAQPEPLTEFVQGAIKGTLRVEATATLGATLRYEWFRSGGGTGGDVSTGRLSAEFPIPTGLEPGTYCYYCVVGASGGAQPVSSAIATVVVAAPEPDTDPEPEPRK